MDIFKSFINQIYECVPFATKVLKVSEHIKSYQNGLKKDKRFCDKFVKVLKMFIASQITIEDMCNIMAAVDSPNKLTADQIDFLCQQVQHNHEVMRILHTFVDEQHIDDQDIHELAKFLITEISNSIIYCR
ncbi:ac75-like protein [Clanis bilineata nucleopolyhedrovirus]|uniref:Ac75-like protein n=1 Tax=Clanis bilineata nucleopolyhedrovirus TaxID=1307957 RepID=Q0N433_9ABAC|nr:ac75-like protein [Clanis bilineata nucleopolyhedrovirus]ABF47410.1 ac75-like protein [Clanis bilineata nucleopolyhedrovirus]